MSEKLETFAVLAAKILSHLYDQFPAQSPLNKDEALRSLFDFDVLLDTKRKPSTRIMYRDMVTDLLKSQTPHLREEERTQLEEVLKNEEGLKRDEELQQAIVQLESRARELSGIWEGTVSFLKFEGYIREGDSLWQLTEKGFAHLRKKFSETKIEDSRGTLISRIKEHLSNPSIIAAQSLLQIISGAAGNIF